MISKMTSSAKVECLLSPEPAEIEGVVKVTVQTPGGVYEFPCSKGEALLHAGLRKGVQLPYECATGTCGTCRGRLMTGDVDIGWEESPALAKLKRDKGDILLCQARARSDCVVRVPAKIAQTDGKSAPSAMKGRLKNSRLLTRDVIEFTIALSRPMTFEAGQFVLVTADPVVGARAYSMVNYDAPETDEIVLVAKRKPGGGFCDWLFSGFIDDTKVEIFGPLGRATFVPQENKNLVIAAGGSGIAGMMAILERATQANYFASHRGYVFFGVPTLSDAFYLDDLADYVTRALDGLEVTLALSNEKPPGFWHPSYEGIRLASGFVHAAMSESMAGRYEDVTAFIAGPPPMVDAALRSLVTEGRLSPQSIRYDKFG
jgi:toluene monooxygenase electron transfer component